MLVNNNYFNHINQNFKFPVLVYIFGNENGQTSISKVGIIS